MGFSDTFERCLGIWKYAYVTIYTNTVMQNKVTRQCKKHERKCLERVAGKTHDFVLKHLSEENWDLEC